MITKKWGTKANRSVVYSKNTLKQTNNVYEGKKRKKKEIIQRSNFSWEYVV